MWDIIQGQTHFRCSKKHKAEQSIQLISPYVVNNEAADRPRVRMIWGLRNTQVKQMMELNHINGTR